MKLREELLELAKKAAQNRETGDMPGSLAAFAQIQKRLPELKTSTDEADQKAYIGIMGQVVICHRQEANKKTREALETALEVYQYSQEHQRDDPNAVRGVWSCHVDLGHYEQAIPFLEEMISLIPVEQTARVGETQAHLAYCQFRSGLVESAAELIITSLQNIETNESDFPPLEIAVWQSYALMTKAIIVNAQGDKKNAQLCAQKALEIAQSQNAEIRIQQAHDLLKFLSRSK